MNGSLNRILLVIIQHTIHACNQWHYVNRNVQLFHKQSVLAWFQLISSVLMQIILLTVSIRTPAQLLLDKTQEILQQAQVSTLLYFLSDTKFD